MGLHRAPGLFSELRAPRAHTIPLGVVAQIGIIGSKLASG